MTPPPVPAPPPAPIPTPSSVPAPRPAPDGSGGLIGPVLTDPDGLTGFDPLGWLTRALGLAGSMRDPASSVSVASTGGSVWGWLVIAGLGCVAVAAGVWVIRRWSAILTRRKARWAHGARFVEILPPPVVEVHGATAFWSQLAGLARDPWPRWRHGQPHITFEIHARSGRLRIGCWVPSVISPRRIEHTVRAAWPGALTRTHRLDIPNPLGDTNPHPDPTGTDTSDTAEGRRGPVGVVCAGWLPLGRHPVWPLRTEHDTDPLRAVLGALTGLKPGQTACIQIYTRPASGAAAARFRREATNPTTARGSAMLARLGMYLPSAWSHTLASPVSLVSGPLAAIALSAVIALAQFSTKILARAVMALAREGLGVIAGLFAPIPRDRAGGAHNPTTGAATRRGTVAANRPRPVAGPTASGGSFTRASGVDRVVARKVNQATGLWEVQLRYATTLTPSPQHAARLTPAGWRRVRRACVGHAGELAGAMAIYSGHNHLQRRPLHPTDWPALAGRWMNSGQLLSTAELAALAHLPTDTRIPGLTRAGAVAVDQPPDLLAG